MANNNFGYYNMTNNTNIPTYPIPVVSNEYIGYAQQAQNNVSVANITNSSSVNSSENLESQKVEYSGDLGLPPLPNQDNLPSEEEVYSNSKL